MARCYSVIMNQLLEPETNVQVLESELLAERSKKVERKCDLSLTVGFDPIYLSALETTMDQTTTTPQKKCVLNGVTISLQNFGTRLAIFLQGEKEAIEQRYYSFWNHATATGELEWWSDNCAFLWIWDRRGETCMEQLERGLTFAVNAELQNEGRHPKQDSLGYALKIARQRIASMEWVNWIQWTAYLNLHGFADSVGAEKGTGNFDDDVIAPSLERTGSNLDVRKLNKQLDEEETAETA